MSSDGNSQRSERDNNGSEPRNTSSDSSHMNQQSSSGIVNHGFSDPDRPEPIQTRHLPTGVSAPVSDLPDILNSTLPPYTSPEHTITRSRIDSRDRGRLSVGQQARGGRRRDGRHSHDRYVLDDDIEEICDKNCCTACLTLSTQFKWILVLLAIIGLCCVVAGIILGALHMTGSSFLTLSLMFIGLGVMLVIVVIIGWRCTPSGHEPCHLLFSLGEYSQFHRRRGGRRRRGSNIRERIHNWSGGVIYGDHYHRPPPPSYAASMQDYERQHAVRQHPNPDSLPSSPPPTYKSQASLQRPGIHITFPHIIGGDYPSSRPPTYRSNHSNTITHSRQIPFQESELPPTSTENSSGTVERTVSSVNGAPTPVGTVRTTAVWVNGAAGSDGSPSNHDEITSKETNNSSSTQSEPGSMSRRHNTDSDQPEISGTVVSHQQDESSLSGSVRSHVEENSVMLRTGHYGTAERNAVECLENVLDTTMRDMNVQYHAGTLVRPGTQGMKSNDSQSTNGASDGGTPPEQGDQMVDQTSSPAVEGSSLGTGTVGHMRASSGPSQVPVDGHTRQFSGSPETNTQRLPSSTLPPSGRQPRNISSAGRTSGTLPHSRRPGPSQAEKNEKKNTGALPPANISHLCSTLPPAAHRSDNKNSSVSSTGRSRHGGSLVESVQAAAAMAASRRTRGAQVLSEHRRQFSDPVVNTSATNYCKGKEEAGTSADPVGTIQVQDTEISTTRPQRGHVRVNSTSGQSAL